jgi:tetratricopeptide (TPR) repeat protein
MDDDAILDAIFNNGPTDYLITTEDKLTEDYPNLMQLKQFEFDALALAQEGKLEESVQVFSKAIEACPLYASAYNNRAQAFRLLNQNDKALLDLDKAIEYGAKQPNILKQV